MFLLNVTPISFDMFKGSWEHSPLCSFAYTMVYCLFILLTYSPFDICSCSKYFRCITFGSLCQALCCYYFTLSFSFRISLREPQERT